MSSIVFTTWTTPLVCVDDPMTTTIHVSCLILCVEQAVHVDGPVSSVLSLPSSAHVLKDYFRTITKCVDYTGVLNVKVST